MSPPPDPARRLRIDSDPSPRRFLEVTGLRIALLGREDGVFECWMWPLCLFDGFQLSFRGHGSSGFAPGRNLVARVSVDPHAFELVYAGDGFRVRQTCFASPKERALTSVFALESGGPVEVEARITPAMRAQWPAGLGGTIAAHDEATNALILTEELGRFAALVGSPAAAPIEVHADHGLTRDPVSFVMRLEPGQDPAVLVVAGAQVAPQPLSDAARLGEAEAARGFSRADRAIEAARSLWRETALRGLWRATTPRSLKRHPDPKWVAQIDLTRLAQRRVGPMSEEDPMAVMDLWARFTMSRRLTDAKRLWRTGRASDVPPAEPFASSSRSLWHAPPGEETASNSRGWLRYAQERDPFRAACEWAQVAIDRAWVEVDGVGRGLLAGLAPADGGARPGFGWIFDGDAMTAARALTACGQFAQVREILRLAAGRQREDGKLMHELVLSAGLCNWTQEYPYAFYKAGNTPALVAVLDHYVETSGDLALARELLPNVRNAIEWCARCCDEHGLLANSKAGIAAVEAGPLVGRIQAEVYLNGIWMSALAGGERLSNALDERGFANRCATLLASARRGFETFWSEEQGRYGFASLRDGTSCDDLTAYTAHPMSRGQGTTERIRRTVAQLNHPALVADWGARMFSTRSSSYDPHSYNTGAVFPYLTNFVCLALYEQGDPMAGRQVLDGLLALHGFSGLGFVPEHLRGDVAVAPTRGVPHQIFSSAAVLQSVVYGAWGIRCEAARRVRWAPASGVSDLSAQLRIPIGNTALNTRWLVEPERSGFFARIQCAKTEHGADLVIDPRFPLGTRVDGIVVWKDNVRVSFEPETRIEPGQKWYGAWRIAPGPSAQFGHAPLREGEASRDLRLLHTRLEGAQVVWRVAGLPGSTHNLLFRPGRTGRIRGASHVRQHDEAWSDRLQLQLPASSSDYVEHEIVFELE